MEPLKSIALYVLTLPKYAHTHTHTHTYTHNAHTHFTCLQCLLGKGTRDAMLGWLAAVMEGNMERAKMQVCLCLYVCVCVWV